MSKRPRGRPRKPPSDVLFIRVPKVLSKQIRDKAVADKRDISATITLMLENALKDDRIAT